jgi:cell division protein FtsL
MSTEAEREAEIRDLTNRVTRAENRLADIDFWSRVTKWSGITLVVLIAAAVTLTTWLLNFKSKVDQAMQDLSTMENRIRINENKVDGLETHLTDLQNHRMDAALLAHARRLGVDQQPAVYTGDDYKSDLQQLAALSQEYLYRLSENSTWDSDNSANQAIQEAAKRIGTRAEYGLNRVVPADTNLHWHAIDTPKNFLNILEMIKSDRAQGNWKSDYLICYQDEFPVWLNKVGVFGDNRANSKSLYCQTLLGIPDCYDSHAGHGVPCTKAEP